MTNVRSALLALVAALVVCGSVTAQDTRLVEAARKEGKVVWYTSLVLPSAEKVAKRFEAAYPGIQVEVHRTGSERILQRLMQELQANIKQADVIHTSDAGHFVLLKERKLLAKARQETGLPIITEFDDDTAGLGNTDGLTPGRATPGGTYSWFFPTGTRAAVTGRVNDDLRIRLSPGSEA